MITITATDANLLRLVDHVIAEMQPIEVWLFGRAGASLAAAQAGADPGDGLACVDRLHLTAL